MTDLTNPGSTWQEDAVSAARAIPMVVVDKKGHGHAGTAMALAPLMHTLFQDVMIHDPADPTWEGRDRFILSAGHASLALYVQLYLTGYGLELSEIEQARAYGTRTPGHPEIDITPGVDMSTGPLGQGLAASVGLAGALRHKRALLGETSLFDNTVWVVAGDGCLQEGVSAEASSLAGNLSLDNLVVVWDDNKITIDGDDRTSFREDTRARYRSYGWKVLEIEDPNNLDEIRRVLEQAKGTDRPVLVAYPSVIGYPAPNRSGTSAAHAGSFGAEEVAATNEILGYEADVSVDGLVSDELLESTQGAIARGERLHKEWEEKLQQTLQENDKFAAEYKWLGAKAKHKELSLARLDELESSLVGESLATRVASGKILGAIGDLVPLWGGSADLSGSTSVAIEGEAFSAENPTGNQWYFGIREHAMAAVVNGIALEGTWRAYCSTYLAFSDYMRPAIRIGALMNLPVIDIFTHDSVAVGEDGPTHQPVEQVAGLGSVPGVALVRPADSAETLGVWKRMVANPEGPVALALSRQNLPALDSSASVGGAANGGYVVWQEGDGDDLILIAAGSEVAVAKAVGEKLAGEGIAVRVVSMPSQEWFDSQPVAYRESVLPPNVRARVAIEAGTSRRWWKYVGLDGEVIGIDQFGTSGPGDQVLRRLGISEQNLEEVAREILG